MQVRGFFQCVRPLTFSAFDLRRERKTTIRTKDLGPYRERQLREISSKPHQGYNESRLSYFLHFGGP
jgi:hypothetical protein